MSHGSRHFHFPGRKTFLGLGYLFCLDRLRGVQPSYPMRQLGGNLRFWLCVQYLSPIGRRCHIFPGKTAYSYQLFYLKAVQFLESTNFKVVESNISTFLRNSPHFPVSQSFFIILDPLHNHLFKALKLVLKRR